MRIGSLTDEPTHFDGPISASLEDGVWTLTAQHGEDTVLTLVSKVENPNGNSCGSGTSIAFADGSDSYSTLFGIGGTCLLRVEDDEPGQVSGTFSGTLINEAGNQQLNLSSGAFCAATDG